MTRSRSILFFLAAFLLGPHLGLGAPAIVCQSSPPEICSAGRNLISKVESFENPLAGLELRTSELERDCDNPAHLGRRQELIDTLYSIAKEGGQLWSRYRFLSSDIDRLGSPLNEVPHQVRSISDSIAKRLAELRDRCAALQKKLGIEQSGNIRGNGGFLDSSDELTGSDTGFNRSALKAIVLPNPSSIWRDDKTIENRDELSLLALPRRDHSFDKNHQFQWAKTPQPPSRPSVDLITERADTFLARGPVDAGLMWTKSARSMKGEQAWNDKVRDMKRRGETITLGNPLERAKLVHKQTGRTCSIVAQQQLLLAYGVLPSGDARKQEDALFDEARRKKYFHDSREDGGTYWQYVGNLLQDHGLIIVKHAHATDRELIEAVSSGKILLADVDSERFWYNLDFRGASHSIVITGLERSNTTRRVLGFYVNDSDDGVYHAAGRLVPADIFIDAWRKVGSRFIEVR